MTRYYEDWTENEYGIWALANGMCIKGPFADIELLREELRERGLSDEGCHNT